MRLKSPTTYIALVVVLGLWIPPLQANESRTEHTRALTHEYFKRMSALDESAAEFWADNIVLFVSNDGPWGGHYGGKANVTQYYRDMAGMFDLEKDLEFELQQTVVDGNHSSIRFRVQGQHVLGPYDNVYMQVYTWNEEGKLTNIDNFYGWGPFLEFHRRATAEEKTQ